MVLVLGRHALQALRAPVVDAPAKAHFAHTEASTAREETAVQKQPCLCPHDASTAREAAAATAPQREAALLLLATQRRSMRSPGCPKDKLSGKIAEQEASVRNSLERSAGSLIVYGHTELEPRTHYLSSGLAACKTLAAREKESAASARWLFSASDVRKKPLPHSSPSAPPSRRSSCRAKN